METFGSCLLIINRPPMIIGTFVTSHMLFILGEGGGMYFYVMYYPQTL